MADQNQNNNQNQNQNNASEQAGQVNTGQTQAKYTTIKSQSKANNATTPQGGKGNQEWDKKEREKTPDIEAEGKSNKDWDKKGTPDTGNLERE